MSMPPTVEGAAHRRLTGRSSALCGTANRCYNRYVLELRLLGPLEVKSDEGSITIAGQRQRALLALLALRAGQVVPSETLVELLWGESPPPTAATSLQNAVSQLRKALGSSVLLTKPPGYLLDVDREQVDLGRFQRLASRARDRAAAERAALLREALGLWRGAPLADFPFESWAQAEVHGLEELRLSALEDLLDAELELGRHAEVVRQAEPLVHEHPLRERPIGQLMLALYRSGRQAEALELYHAARRRLVDELGIEPGRELQSLFARILRQEAALESSSVHMESGDQLDEVVRALLAGRLVPVLGAGVNLAEGSNGDAILPLRDELAAHLAAAFDCPPERAGELTKVAQWVAITQGVGPLYDTLHAVFDRDYEPGAVHRFLASLPSALRERGLPQQVIVTTNYDRALEQAFAQAGEPFDVVSYISLGRDRGKFLHRSADGGARVIHLPNAYADVPLDTRPVILKIHGEVDREPARDAESFVVSEDDYIAYLAETGIGGVLPVTLAARLRRSHFLFLGYGLLDWSLRVFLQRLWPDDRAGYRSWAVQPGAGSLEREFWRRHGVELVDAGLGDYVDPLSTRIRAGAAVAS
jgi:DNA-binding SARP family transcriptional activator